MDNEIAEELPHNCPVCGRGFKTSNALLAHSRAHKKYGVNETPDEEKQVTQWVAPEPGPIPHDLKVPENEILEQTYNGRSGSLTGWSIPVVKLYRHLHYRDLPDIAKATPGSAGYDLYAAIENHICIGAGERDIVPTGLSIELPQNFVAKIVPRSGLALRNGISLLNTPGIIDSDYRGEIKAILINHSRTKFWLEPGMRIAQMIIERLPEIELQFIDELSNTSRGSGGFGSTGTK